MVDFYFWPTPNGYKIAIMLEESEQRYKVHAVNLGKGDQHTPEFLKISPNGKMPAIVDNEPNYGKGTPISLFESGAILWYLGEKTGRYIPQDAQGKASVSEWLFWQVGGLGPMAGQLHHFLDAPEKIPYAIERYQKETDRLYSVLNKRLEGRNYISGEYSIADMAIFPWVAAHKSHNINLADYTNIKTWHDRIAARAAVQKAYKIRA